MTTLPPLAAFVGGVLTLFAPCSAMILPAFFAYAFTSTRTLLARTGVFWLGLLAVLVPLGAAAGGVGAWLRDYGAALTVAAAALIIVLGAVQVFGVELPKFRFPGRRFPSHRRGVGPLGGNGSFSATSVGSVPAAGPRSEDSSSPTAVFLLGAVYGLAGVGCAGPILGAVLLTAGIEGSPLAAAGLMALYATGMAVPLTVLSLVWRGLNPAARGWIRPRPLRLLGRWTTWTNVVSGALFIALGVGLLVFGTSNPLGSLLPAEQLASWESRVIAALAALPWWLPTSIVVLGVATVAVLVAAVRKR